MPECDFGPRLEQVYQNVTGEESPRGAKAWWARLNSVQAYTVTRWCQGMAPPSVLAHLSTMETIGAMQGKINELKETNGFLNTQLGRVKTQKKKKVAEVRELKAELAKVA